jgi:hypothetical protein
MRTTLLRTACLAIAALLLLSASALAQDKSVRVSVGSPTAGALTPFSQNKQNEPAVAVDAANPNVVASGSNDEIDMEKCNPAEDNTCPFTPGVGVSGIYFSQSSGHSWTQPEYRGNSARTCEGVPGTDTDPECVPTPNGTIGTLPNYYEHNLVSDGDPALAFGPRYLGNGAFASATSKLTTLYYANLTSPVPGKASPFKGAEAIAVSRTDDIAGAQAGNNASWSAPVIASKQSSAQFSDKEQIWADNAQSSKYYGNVYVCYANFRSNGPSGNQPLEVLVSSDGARSFTQHQVTSATNNVHSRNGFGRSGCTVRTDSKGVVYVFDYQFAASSTGAAPGKIQQIKSTDGGRTFSRPVDLFTAYDTCNYIEASIGRCVEDGVGGARSDLSPAPSVDIANGAPSGADATNRLVMSWVDGRTLNDEKVQFSTSGAGGTSWTSPSDIREPAPEPAGTQRDRGYYSAPAIAPDGSTVYVVYNAFNTPFRPSAVGPENNRNLVGVVRTAPASASGVGAFTTANRTVGADARSSSQNSLSAEFLGDYVYAAATRTYGTSVWNDVRSGADCPAIDNYRQALHDEAVATGTQTSEPEEPRGADSGKDAAGDPGDDTAPAPEQQCPGAWGESDIYGVTIDAPVPAPSAARRR